MLSPVRVFIVLALITLTACGFTPMYGAASRGGDVPHNLDNVEIAMIPDQSGVYLRNLLIDNFYGNGYPSSPTHILRVEKIKETERDLDITRDSEATRQQLKLTTTMNLTDKATGEVVLSRRISAITSHNILDSQFTTRVSEADAREAAIADMARQIETQTALYFKR